MQVRGTSSIIAAVKGGGDHAGAMGRRRGRPGGGTRRARRRRRRLPDSAKPGSLATIDALEQLSNEPDLEWSYLAPSAELEWGQRTAQFRLGEDQLLTDENGRSHISVQDYAAAMINELETPVHVRQRFTVGY